ncbi:winged helix-turn-helix domain-containing protein [Pseudoalteromonas sp. GB56]
MYRIGEYVFDYQHALLSKGTESKKIEPQLNELLKLFVDNRGELVPRQALIDTLWPNRVITDDAYRAVIKKLRKCLADDAKSPRYIRTVPTKGFVLIAIVEDLDSQPPEPRVNAQHIALIATALFVAAIALFVQWQVPSTTEQRIEKLTTMLGSEVSPAYDATNQVLIFSQRANKDDFLQLFSKQLTTNTTTRLTFDDANYANAHFSPDGLLVAYTRSTPEHNDIFIADYSLETGITNAIALPKEVADKRYLQSWSADGEGLYLSDTKQPNASQKVWYFHLSSSTLTNITAPATLGQGDYVARESQNGQRIALLRSTSDKGTELLIQHKQSGELTHIQALPQPFHTLIWDEEDTSITLSSFTGEFAQFNLDTQELSELPIPTKHINNVFYRCAKRCVFARQHNGNYLDLTTSPNPFNENQQVSHEYHEFVGNEDLVQLSANTQTVYFITQLGEQTQLVSLKGSQKEILKTFPKLSQFSVLQLNHAQTQLAGILDGRLFTYDLKSGAFTYLSSELEQIATAYWQQETDALMFSRIEYAQPVLYRYDPKAQTKIRISQGLYAQVHLGDKAKLLIDNKLKVWINVQGQEPQFVTQLDDANPNRWRLNNEWFYYAAHEENLAFLYRQNVKTGKHENTLLAKNRYRLSFDLSSDGDTFIGIRSVLAQSDLVKVSY